MTIGAKVGFKVPRPEYVYTLREWISGERRVRVRRTKGWDKGKGGAWSTGGVRSRNKDDQQTQFRQ